MGPVRHAAAAEVGAHVAASLAALGSAGQHHREAHVRVEHREGVVDPVLVDGAVVAGRVLSQA